MLRTLNHNSSEDCANKLGYDYNDIVLEIKCPYPNADIVNLHCNVPLRYVTQLLLEMKVKNVQKAWYVRYTEQSTVFSEFRFNEAVWLELWEYIKELCSTRK